MNKRQVAQQDVRSDANQAKDRWEEDQTYSPEAIQDRVSAKTEVLQALLTLQMSGGDYRHFGINE